MNKADRTRLANILANANALLNSGDNGNGITNIDVLEAVLNDIGSALANRTPDETTKLLKRDVKCNCGKTFQHLSHYKGCAVIVARFDARTADGVAITDGLAVWDYNLEAGHVSLKRLDYEGWFEVCKPGQERGSMMDADRVCVRHPFTGKLASDALKGGK